MVILAIAVMGIASLWCSGFAWTKQSDEMGEAYAIARHEVEKFRALNPTAVANGTYVLADGTYFTNYDSQGRSPASSPYYQAESSLTTPTDQWTWSDGNPGLSPAPSTVDYTWIRELRVTVRRYPVQHDDQPLFDTTTYFSTGGI